MSLTIGSLCTGYGGLDLAVEAVTGAKTIWVSDIDPGANKIIEQRFPDVPNIGDMTSVDWSAVTPVDILTGGTPCQDLSAAGKRAGMSEGTRSNLWVNMREAIAVMRPKLVVWENVRGALSAKADSDLGWAEGLLDERAPEEQASKEDRALRALGRVLGDLAEIGYDAQWATVRASDVGAPHQRARIFLLAYPADARGEALQVRGRLQPGEPEALRGERPSDRDRTAEDALRPGGWGWAFESFTGEAGGSDTAVDGADHRPAASGDSAGVTMLPAPRATRGGSATETVELLPTPNAAAGSGRGYQHPDVRKAGGHQVELGSVAEHILLPTPKASDGEFGLPRTSGRPPEKSTHLATRVHFTDFGQYAPAIERWEEATGRPTPAPTNPSPKTGKPQLSAEFVEWMMGLPKGWVSDTGLTRAQQLKALGNGVVPQQAAAALTLLLSPVG